MKLSYILSTQALNIIKKERDDLLRGTRGLEQTIQDLREQLETISDCQHNIWAHQPFTFPLRSSYRLLGSDGTSESLLIEEIDDQDDRTIALLMKKNEDSLREIRQSMIQTRVELEIQDYCREETHQHD